MGGRSPDDYRTTYAGRKLPVALAAREWNNPGAVKKGGHAFLGNRLSECIQSGRVRSELIIPHRRSATGVDHFERPVGFVLEPDNIDLHGDTVLCDGAGKSGNDKIGITIGHGHNLWCRGGRVNHTLSVERESGPRRRLAPDGATALYGSATSKAFRPLRHRAPDFTGSRPDGNDRLALADGLCPSLTRSPRGCAAALLVASPGQARVVGAPC